MSRPISLNINGRRLVFPNQQEFNLFCVMVGDHYRKKVLPVYKRRFSEGKTLHDHFQEINGEQPVVSWFVELTRRTKLPPRNLVVGAENALKDFEQAATCGDLKWMHRSLPICENAVNRLLREMKEYAGDMIDGAGNWGKGLTFVKGVSFGALSAAAVVYTGGASLTVMGSTGAAKLTAAGAVGVLQSMAEETGKAASGSSNQTLGSATTNIATAFFTSAVLEKILGGKWTGELSKKVSAKLLSKLGEKIAPGVSKEVAEKLIAEYFEETGKSVLGGAIQDAGKAITDKDARSLDLFLDNVVNNLTTGGIEGKLSSHIVGKAAPMK